VYIACSNRLGIKRLSCIVLSKRISKARPLLGWTNDIGETLVFIRRYKWSKIKAGEKNSLQRNEGYKDTIKEGRIQGNNKRKTVKQERRKAQKEIQKRRKRTTQK
jgi:hypothetical protein